MRKLSLTLALTVFFIACTANQVVTALTDAKLGLAAGCGFQQWVPAADCQIATDGLDAAIVIANNAPVAERTAAVLKVVQSTEAALPAGSRAVPYFHYLVPFLIAILNK